MAAYHRVDNLLSVTCGLTACTPESAPGPTLGNAYIWEALTFSELYDGTSIHLLLVILLFNPVCSNHEKQLKPKARTVN